MVGPDTHAAAAIYVAAQRNLVLLSLLLCPAGGRHQGKGHESKDRDLHGDRH